MYKLKDIVVGCKVGVRTWGSNGITWGIVEAVETDIKNGRPGIDYVVCDSKGVYMDRSHWAYLDQVESVWDKFILRGDDDMHWYMIPVKLVAKFDALLAAEESLDEFDEYFYCYK
jgi:hypothetical protein